MAIKRCENQYQGKSSKCQPLMGTMAVKSCPSGYERNGCCQCVVPCPAGYWEHGGLFCLKSDPIKTTKYSSYKARKNDQNIPGDCELYGVNFFTKNCPHMYERNGELMCMQKCPLGWPDYGQKCMKVGSINNGMPTVWQPGDEESEDEEVDIKVDQKKD